MAYIDVETNLQKPNENVIDRVQPLKWLTSITLIYNQEARAFKDI